MARGLCGTAGSRLASGGGNPGRRVKLRNTMDLIYPGAERFYGHGFIVPYELDWIAVRAGWVLEELTFQDFGFREVALTKDALIDGLLDRPVREAANLPPEPETLPSDLDSAVTRAREWYATLDLRTCLGSLIEALTSGRETRQMDALGWLRHGRTPCDGLDVESYGRDIEPLVRQLASGGTEPVREQARLLLRDEEMYWLSIKPQETAR